MEKIFEQAETIASDPQKGPDEAAKFLSQYRIQAAKDLSQNSINLGNLLSIVTAQIRYLNDANLSDKAIGIAEWFLHIFHHFPEIHPDCDLTHIKFALRDSLAAFFRHYAKSLRNTDRIEDMHHAMTNSMDLSREIPMSVVFLIHLYTPLLSRETIEATPSRRWFLDRLAECLAALDFAGQNQTPFRCALDNYQYAIRCPDKYDELYLEIEQLSRDNPNDPALKTLFNLYKKEKT